MNVRTLAASAPYTVCIGDGEVLIDGITSDSRAVRPGMLFAAIPGTRVDGSAFIPDALARGASAILCASAPEGCPVPALITPTPRKALSYMAEALYGNPSKKLSLIGITGTNGKTTIAYLLRQMLTFCGMPCGMIGTVEIHNGQDTTMADMTTPDSIAFSCHLAEMVANGCTAAAVEVSSHALDQDRVAGATFAGAVFTNLTRDHLDYHQTMDAYRSAKGRLFAELPSQTFAVLNMDDPTSDYLARNTRASTHGYGFAPTADIHVHVEDISLDGTRATFVHHNERITAQLHLIGQHNLSNAMAALSATVCAGVPFSQAVAALEMANGAPGRLERVESECPLSVFVDYAHTDDALRNVLSILRELAPKKLSVVFGCGGDRDRGKRPLMAQAAEKYADRIYVTSDNPRTEKPEAILEDIMAGFSSTHQPIVCTPDRRDAIRAAIDDAEDGDVILIAGKGHECYQIIGTEKYPFDDHVVARTALRSRYANNPSIA